MEGHCAQRETDVTLFREFTTQRGNTMDLNSINGILRAVVPAVLAYAVGKGWISSSSVADITAGVVAVAAAIWSVITNKPTA